MDLPPLLHARVGYVHIRSSALREMAELVALENHGLQVLGGLQTTRQRQGCAMRNAKMPDVVHPDVHRVKHRIHLHVPHVSEISTLISQ